MLFFCLGGDSDGRLGPAWRRFFGKGAMMEVSRKRAGGERRQAFQDGFGMRSSAPGHGIGGDAVAEMALHEGGMPPCGKAEARLRAEKVRGARSGIFAGLSLRR